MSKRMRTPQQQAAADKQFAEDLQFIFGSSEGKRVLKELMKQYHVLSIPYDPCPHLRAVKEGQRAVVMQILATLNTNPSDFIQLQKEIMHDY